MKKIKTLVVDDEPLARARIVHLLESVADIQILGECKNGREALQAIEKYQPELVFLDIQMPDFDGFDVLARQKEQLKPFIIFVTAFDQYALKAFDYKAVDYLLKPYDDDRFMQALEHARQQIHLKRKAFLHEKMIHLLQDHESQVDPDVHYFEIKEKGQTFRVNAYDLYAIEAQGNYLKLCLSQKNFMLRQTLQGIENQLDPDCFLRIHRSIIINTNYLQGTRYLGNHQYSFRLKNKSEWLSSRSYESGIHAYFKDQNILEMLDQSGR